MTALNEILILQYVLHKRSAILIDSNKVESQFDPIKMIQNWTLFDKSIHLDEEQVNNYIKKEQLDSISLDQVKKKIEELLVSFKSDWIAEIKDLENKWTDIKTQIKDIETGKMDKKALYDEYIEAKSLKEGGNDVGIVESTTEEKAEEADRSEGETQSKEEIESPQKSIHKRTRSKSKIEGSTELSDVRDELNKDRDEPVAKRSKINDEDEIIVVEQQEEPKEDESLEPEVQGDVGVQTQHLEEKELAGQEMGEEESPALDISDEVEPAGSNAETKKEEEKDKLNEEGKEEEEEEEEESPAIEAVDGAQAEKDEGEEKQEESPVILVDDRDKATKTRAEQEEKDLKGSKEQEVSGKPIPSSKIIQNMFIQILSQLESHRFSSMFLNPVSASDEPEYFDLIRKPTSLKTIHRKVRSGEIDTLEKLENEINLMLANAVMYNDTNEELIGNSIKGVEAQWEDLRNILKESIYG